jgi:pyridoxamine 5'-phosphate oxidase
MADSDPSIKSLLRSLPSLKGPFKPDNFTHFPDTPQQAFTLWLNNAIAHGVKEPHAMTLSTVDADGFPDARVLILKNVDDRGWHFASKADSPKGLQIASSPKVALTFYWPQLGRQVRIRGRAAELSASESAADFLERPLGSRATAVASLQSERMDDTIDLGGRIADAQALIEGNPDYVSVLWRLYAVAPETVEFWQGATDRLHRRLRFEKHGEDGQWVKCTLYP